MDFDLYGSLEVKASRAIADDDNYVDFNLKGVTVLGSRNLLHVSSSAAAAVGTLLTKLLDDGTVDEAMSFIL